MGVLPALALLVIIYFCAKAIRSILRDAFGTVGDNSSKRRQTRSQQQTTAAKPKKNNQKPIQKGEGEYVDYEEV